MTRLCDNGVAAGTTPPGLLCGVVGNLGPHGEPIACGYPPHDSGDHSWATLPTFVAGSTLIERAAREYVEASKAEAERVARTRRAMDPKSPEWQRKLEALGALVEAVEALDA